ncbi:MAG TPA: DEAD/DEAH box helicase family protein [Candidatus Paceibacterota bacterium]|nr:DEAD/DEAH box helicase family protein [Candidatus Paceibacterota bacterium]
MKCSHKKPVVNAQSTEAAREKQERIKERFKEWVWSDDSRRERLCRLYNDTFNHTRVRTFNGDHLTLPGASGAIQLHSHQKAGVWRILQTPNTLLAHVVGAGKTYTMVAAAMESRRLGLSGKPMFVVPNHMLGQFSTELLTLYPGANILAAGKEDFESQNRKKLFSRIATGNWDAVIVTHSGFERIPLSRETQERFFKEQLHELEMIKRQHADSSNRRLVKELEKAKKRLEAKLQTLAAEHKKDNTLTFEELGVDRLLVDEAHYFKNLFYVTKMTRVAGLPQTASERAFDMFLKVRHVQSLNGGGGVVFATGTPIANSMAEMFTMQRYLQHDELKKHNLHHFDSWAATFGEPVTAMELSPDGAGYRLNTRFARFINLPELMQMFLDAPWRPADVEQREGRILRQGNKNSVIQIFRYVTEGSFDAYMWQTLETKAKFIAQVMSGDMTIRRLEDLDSAALTYAEVKAIASGNPLVIEKAQVDAELIRLTRLRSAHAEEQYRIRSNLRHSHQEVQTWTERLANLREDLTLRQDTSGDKFRIELDKQTLDNRGVAGELLLRRAEKIKTRFGEDNRIGRFAGFDLFIRSGFNDTAELVLRGKNSYSTRVTDTALGTIRSLESTVQGFEERATRLETDIKESQKRAAELEAKVGSPFEKEERYHHLARRQSEIEEQLDLTKNQAPSQVDAAENTESNTLSEQPETVEPPTIKPKRGIKV